MARFFRKRDQLQGQVPGSLIFVGTRQVQQTSIRVMDYDAGQLNEFVFTDVNQIKDLHSPSACSWVDIYGLHDVGVINEIGSRFNVHSLVLEDVLNTGQRPKLEEFGHFVFLVLKMFRYDKEEEIVHAEQLSMVIGKGVLITFQERKGDVFEAVRERIRKMKGRIRQSGVDYLAYALLDTVVDNYIDVIERIGEHVEELDEKVLEEPDKAIIAEISSAKREINYMRKSIRPARDAIIQLGKLDTDLISDYMVPFLKDLQDLATHATEVVEIYREMLTDQMSIYHSSLSNRMNDVMKVLTIFAAIFIPLTFIAGIYGTNFEYLPELHYRYSYFVFWGVIIAVAGGLLFFFKKKGWF
jgi:magnesium transporter